MKRDELFQIGAYVTAACLAVGGAFLVSSRFLASARAQQDAASDVAPPAPPEPAMPPATPPEAQAPAASPEPTHQAQPAVPPPPPPANDHMPTEQMPAQQMPAQNPAQHMQDAATLNAVNAANSGIAELEGFLEPFIYDIVNRRDPFQAYAEYVPVDVEGPPRALSPAQRWELEQLKLIGIMWDIKDPKAMFLDPEEEVMILGRDESIGNRNGYIATIREGEVVVVEAIRKRGDIIYRTRVLRIER